MKKRTLSIVIAAAMMLTTLFVPSFSFAASTDATWQTPTSPKSVDDNVVTVAGHAANSSAVHFLGGNLVTARSSDLKGVSGNNTAEQNLAAVAAISEVGVFGTSINDNPDPYWWNLFYNYWAKANNKEESNDAVKVAALGSPMMANNVLIEGVYNDLTKEGTALPHSLGQKADVLLGIGANAGGAGNGYTDLLNTMKDYPDNYNPILVPYKSANLQDHVDIMYDLADALKEVCAEKGKTTRYEDPTEIAKKYEAYVKGLQLYILSEVERGTVDKKTVAVIAPETRSDGTYEAFDSTMARGTAASCRASEYIELTSNNIIETENISNSGTGSAKLYCATADQIINADAIFITVQSTNGTNGDNSAVMNGDEFAAKIAEQAGVSVSELPPIYSVDPNGIFGSIRANSNENALGVGVYQGFLYPELLNPTYASAYFTKNFYHISNEADCKAVTETVMANASLPEGYEADASGYTDAYIQEKIDAGLMYYNANKSRFEETKLVVSDNIDLNDSKYDPSQNGYTSIAEATVTGIADKTYTGKAITPNVTVKVGDKTLTKNKDYKVNYSENKNVGTATVQIVGINNYIGTITKNFKITAKALDISSIAIADQEYTGKAIQPKLTIKDGGKTLSEGSDYTVTCANNTKIGQATATVTLTGNYTGKADLKFNIVQIPMSKVKVSAVAAKAYTGKAIKPTLTVKNGSTTLKSGTDYTATYKNNTNPGKATITITGKGNYKGTKTVNFNITPKKATVSKLTSTKKATLKVTWKKDTKATGYQVVIAKNKKFTSGKKSAIIAKNKTTSKTFTKLTKGKKYYAKVRAYKTISGKKVYGAYSAVKSKTVKKK